MKKTEYPTYKCVSCEFYDQLESWATLSVELSLAYLDEKGATIRDQIFIKDLVTQNKEEYMITQSKLKVRLDRILEIKPIKK